MRAVPGFTKPLPNILKWSKENDQAKSFLSKAAIHIVNRASVRDLKNRVLQKYPNENDKKKIHIDALNFRPSIIIDTFEPYEED